MALVASEAKSRHRQCGAASGHLAVAAVRQGQVEALGSGYGKRCGFDFVDQSAGVWKRGRENGTDGQGGAQGKQRPQMAHRSDSFPRSHGIRRAGEPDRIQRASILEGWGRPNRALSEYELTGGRSRRNCQRSPPALPGGGIRPGADGCPRAPPAVPDGGFRFVPGDSRTAGSGSVRS